ncbi:MAG TPA: type II secretion system protein [Candidatus Paceibacterota bacterium]|nr:type II secretion system protein [Candidatus Paceibacterota bacterium]
MKLISNKKGFTLIELLVVVAIIGLLASIVLASLNTARAKARNAKRAQDIKTMQTVLELYRSNNNGNVPVATGWKCSDCIGGNLYGDPSFFINNFVNPKYISEWPKDPTPVGSRGGADFGYLYLSLNGNDYFLLAYGTVEGKSNLLPSGAWPDDTFIFCSNPSANPAWCLVP